MPGAGPQRCGIRLEGLDLTVRHCWFHHNENGILCGEYHPSTVLIEYSEFGHHGYGDGYSHNLYIGNIDSLIFRFNYSHHADVGHELKSRAWVNVIEYNRFSNEADGTASREIDLPNGGQAYLIGNVVQQGLQSENSNMVGYGLEGLSNPGPHELYAINNTLVNEKTVGSYFQMPGAAYFKAYNNVLAGGGSFMTSWPTNVDTLANVRNTSIAALQFLDAPNYDYRIDESSPAHNAGYPAGLAGSGYPLVAWYEYVHPTEGVLRCQHALARCRGLRDVHHGDGRIAQQRTHSRCGRTRRSGLLNISSDGAGQALGTKLLDMQGRVVDVPIHYGADRTVLDLASLPAGIYMVIVSGQRTNWVRRVIKD